MFKRFAYSRVFICLAILLGLTRCATHQSVSSESYSRPLTDLHVAVKRVMKNAVKKRSENTRTYMSVYHKVGTDTNAGVGKRLERGQIVMTISGDRRPFNIIAFYRIERLSGGKFSLSRYDKRLAQKYLDKVESYLATRPEDRDMIDDFRPY